MAALEHEFTNKPTMIEKAAPLSKVRNNLSGFLFDIPDPATQAAAYQLSRTNFRIDRSFGYCLALLGCAALEELL